MTNKNASNKVDVIKFKEKRFTEGSSYSQNYLLTVPDGGKLVKLNTGHIYKEYQLIFPDSSVIYITNNIESGSRLNYKNRYKDNAIIIRRSNENDSLLLGGMQTNGRFWKEYFIKDMVVGYCNVNADNKIIYDETLSTLRKKN
jgi:hypothetical protein